MSMLTRRQLLASAVATPLLASLLPRRARAAGSFPRRLVIFFTPNGTNPESWFPTPGSGETDFTLKPLMDPLAPFKGDLLITSGINMDSLEIGPGEPHQRGMGTVLTGMHLQEGTFVGGDGTLAGWGDGMSVDQFIANAVGGSTPRKSLELGVRVLGSEVRHRINYAGPAQPLPPRNDPRAVWDEIFAGFSREPGDEEKLKRRRRSALAAVNRNFLALRDKVSAEDREKLDQHRAWMRDMDRRLSATTVAGEQCVQPARPPAMDPDHENNMDDVSSLQIDLAVAALACDITRVVTIQHSSGANNIRFPFLDSYTDDHVLSHAGPADATSQQEWAMRQRWYAGQFARLLGKMKAVREGEGTLLSNSVVLWCSELSQGNTHSHDNMPFMLAGQAGGSVTTGRFVQYANARHNDLLIALCHKMGVMTSTFGDPAYCSGPLAGI